MRRGCATSVRSSESHPVRDRDRFRNAASFDRMRPVLDVLALYQSSNTLTKQRQDARSYQMLSVDASERRDPTGIEYRLNRLPRFRNRFMIGFSESLAYLPCSLRSTFPPQR